MFIEIILKNNWNENYNKQYTLIQYWKTAEKNVSNKSKYSFGKK